MLDKNNCNKKCFLYQILFFRMTCCRRFHEDRLTSFFFVFLLQVDTVWLVVSRKHFWSNLKTQIAPYKNYSSQYSDCSIWFFKVIRVIWAIRSWIKHANTWIPIQLRLTRDTYQHIKYLCNTFNAGNQYHCITI
jgi:hypothetical protein